VTLIYGPLGGFFLLVSLAMLVVKVWALVDAISRPAQAYEVAGKRTKVFWVVILVLSVIFLGIGILGLAALVAAIVYLVDVRPALREVSGGRGSSGGPYGGWR
jgi:fucose 4-O-acetylase-like acetyltransferase